MRDAFNMDVAAVRLRAWGGRHEARKIRYVRYESEGSFRRNRDIDRAAIIGHGVILLIITQNASAAMAMQDCMLDIARNRNLNERRISDVRICTRNDRDLGGSCLSHRAPVKGSYLTFASRNLPDRSRPNFAHAVG
jgi:hypothetical protein